MGSISGITSHTCRSRNMGLVKKTRITVITLLFIVAAAIIFIDKKLSKTVEETPAVVADVVSKDKDKKTDGEEGNTVVVTTPTKPVEEQPENITGEIRRPVIPVIPVTKQEEKEEIKVAEKTKEETKKIDQNFDTEKDQIHVVESGDTIEKIALQYYKSKFYTKALFQYNRSDSFSKPNQLKIGQEIAIPAKEKLQPKEKKEAMLSEKTYTRKPPSKNSFHKYESVGTENGKAKIVSKNSKNERKPVFVKANTENSGKIYHTVERGETVSSISKKYRVPFVDIIEANNILKGNPNCLRPGMVLVVCKKENFHLLPLAGPK